MTVVVSLVKNDWCDLWRKHKTHKTLSITVLDIHFKGPVIYDWRHNNEMINYLKKIKLSFYN